MTRIYICGCNDLLCDVDPSLNKASERWNSVRAVIHVIPVGFPRPSYLIALIEFLEMFYFVYFIFLRTWRIHTSTLVPSKVPLLLLIGRWTLREMNFSLLEGNRIETARICQPTEKTKPFLGIDRRCAEPASDYIRGADTLKPTHLP